MSQHDMIKHIKVYQYFTKEKLDNGLIYGPYMSTSSQLADVLTKENVLYVIRLEGFMTNHVLCN